MPPARAGRCVAPDQIRPTGITLDAAGNYVPAEAFVNPLASRRRIQVGPRLRF